jgi:hypothetical protein
MGIWDYVTAVSIWVFGAVYGWYARERAAKRNIENYISEVENVVKTSIDEFTIQVIIEMNNNNFYVYSKESHEFMAQGSNRKELEEALVKRFPDKKFIIDKENLKVFN